MSYIPNIFRLSPSARTVIDVVDQAVAVNAAYGVTSGQRAVGAAAVGGVALWNPAYNTLLTFTGSPTSATVTFGYKPGGAYPTTPAPTAFVYNGTNTAASLQTYLLTIPGVPAGLTVSGSNGGPYTITYVSSGAIDALAPPLQIVGPVAYVGGTNPTVRVAPPAVVWVYGLSYSDDTGGSLVRVEYLASDPALALTLTPLSKHYRNANTLGGGLLHVANAKAEAALSAVTSTAANVTDSFLSARGGVTSQPQPLDHTLLQPGSGLLVSTVNAAAINMMVNLDWVEFTTAEW